MLGAFVKQRRGELGLDVHELASRSGITASAIYMIERGDRRKLQPDTVLALSRALEVSADVVLSLISSPTPQEVAS